MNTTTLYINWIKLQKKQKTRQGKSCPAWFFASSGNSSGQEKGPGRHPSPFPPAPESTGKPYEKQEKRGENTKWRGTNEEKISVFLSTRLFYSVNVTKRRNFFEQFLNTARRAPGGMARVGTVEGWAQVPAAEALCAKATSRPRRAPGGMARV